MIGVRPALAPVYWSDMHPDESAQLAAALATIAQAQAEIMYALTFLAMHHGDTLPGIRESVDKYSEWLQAQHSVIVEAEQYTPRTIVIVPPLNLDVL